MAEQTVEKFRPVTTATPGTPCGWNAYGETGTKLTCRGGKPAVHVLTETLPVAKAGTALCAYHSPFDPTEAERAAVGQPFQTMGEAGAEVLYDREAEYVKIMEGEITQAYAAGDCACDLITEMGAKRLPAGGRVCQVCGSVFTPEGTEASPEVLAESGRIVAAKIAKRDDMTGIDMLRGLLTLTPVRTPKAAVEVQIRYAIGDTITNGSEGDLGTGEVIAITPDGNVTVRFRSGAESTWSRSVWALTGFRKAPKAAKPRVIHCNDGQAKAPCGADVADDRANLNVGRSTPNPSEVTCKRCPGTVRFQRYTYRLTEQANAAKWANAGLFVGMVVQHTGSGDLGVVVSLGESVRVNFWASQVCDGFRIRTVAEFDDTFRPVPLDTLVSVGDHLVSNLGGEAVVTEVTGSQVWALRSVDGFRWGWTASEFAAEISRGWLAVVPTRKCPVPGCNSGLMSNTQDHLHFGRQVQFTW